MTPEKIKAIIETLAASRGLSFSAAVNALAEETAISQRTLYYWLAGKSSPSRSNARALENFVRR